MRLDALDQEGKLDTPEWDATADRIRKFTKSNPLASIFEASTNAEHAKHEYLAKLPANARSIAERMLADTSENLTNGAHDRNWQKLNKLAPDVEHNAIHDVNYIREQIREDGDDIYRELARKLGDAEASDFLKSLGIRGIKYLDGTSRGKGEGSYNYVIFDDSDVEIKEVHYSKDQKEKIRADAERTAKQLNRLNTLSIANLAAYAKYDVKDGVMTANAAGLTLIRRAIGQYQGDPGTFFGLYGDPDVAKGIIAAVDALKYQHPKLAKVADPFRKAADTDFGDITVVLDGKGPMHTATRQEELSHRADFRVRNENLHEFEPYKKLDSYNKALHNIEYRYPNASERTLHNEVVAKLFRDDATSELGIDQSGIDKIRDVYLNQLIENGITAADLRKAFEAASPKGKEFAQEYENATRSGSNNDAGAISQRKREVPALTGGSGEEGSQQEGLTTLRQAGRSEDLQFAKHTITRKTLNLLDTAFRNTENLSSTRAIENVVNKNLQQLREADEDAYEQVMKLAGTQSQATIEALTAGSITPDLAKAIHDRNMSEMRLTLQMAGLAIPLQKGVPTPVAVQGKTASVIRIGDVPYAVPSWLAKELRPVLAERTEPNAIQKVVRKINMYGAAGIFDAVFHSANVVGTLIGSTPYVGTDILSRTVGNTPVSKWLTTLVQLLRTDPERTDPQMLRDMADAGIIPNRYGTETYSKRLSIQLGAARTRTSLKPFLMGPKGIDIRSRIIMWKIGKHINPNATNTEMADFVNQLGIYSSALESQLSHALKRSDIAPFFTAGLEKRQCQMRRRPLRLALSCASNSSCRQASWGCWLYG